jgi:hypothetical protein
MRNSINTAPLNDLTDPCTPGPVATDEHGRSNQHFVMDVRVQCGTEERRVTVEGRDIYASTAPVVVEAVERVAGASQKRRGAFALGELIDASAFVESIARSAPINMRISFSNGN